MVRGDAMRCNDSAIDPAMRARVRTTIHIETDRLSITTSRSRNTFEANLAAE
jgi:hypothetical protein